MTQPLITVLMPTRGRPTLLRRCVENLLGRATDPSLLEFCFKVDDDDQESWKAVTELSVGHRLQAGIYQTPRGNGYADLHHWLGTMIQGTTGEWITSLSDDTLVLTDGWDELVARYPIYPDGIQVLFARVPQRPGSWECFFVRRKLLEVLGRFPPTPHADTWLASITVPIERAMHVEIHIDHAAAEAADDATTRERLATSRASLSHLCATATSREKLRDAEKLLNHIDRFAEGRA